MLRVFVGVLAALVGFSFGQAIPRWIENRANSDSAPQPPAVPDHAKTRLPFRRKPIRKLRIGIARFGKEIHSNNTVSASGLQGDESQPQACRRKGRKSGEARLGDARQRCSSPEFARAKMQEWKMKLRSLKEKAFARQKIWHEEERAVPDRAHVHVRVQRAKQQSITQDVKELNLESMRQQGKMHHVPVAFAAAKHAKTIEYTELRRALLLQRPKADLDR